MPTREIFWNVEIKWLFYILTWVALVVFGFGFWRRFRLIFLAKKVSFSKEFFLRLKHFFLTNRLGQKRISKRPFPGIMHFLLLSGFIVLLMGTIYVSLYYWFPNIFTFHGSFYLFFSLTLDVFGLFLIVGVGLALYRRLLIKPKDLKSDWQDFTGLGLLLTVSVTGFLVEGLRIAHSKPLFEIWSIIGWQVAKFFVLFDSSTIALLHSLAWWGHAFISLALIAFIPYGKLSHIFFSPARIFYRSLQSTNTLPKIDLETAEEFGTSKISQLNNFQMLELEACTECARCEDNCPPHLAGSPLSLKKMVLNMRDYVRSEYKDLSQGKENKSLVKEVVGEEVIWDCLSCGYCESNCPVYINVFDKVAEFRRHLVLEEGNFPKEAKNAMRNLEKAGDPWGIGVEGRAEWEAELGAEPFSIDRHEWLYWVGCAGSLDSRCRKISSSLVKVLKAANISFGVLGKQEKCTGDPARRLGEEYQFQLLAQENIELLNGRSVKKVLTNCPHCFNTIKNEYPQFGGEYEVVHASQFIEKLHQQGKIKMNNSINKKIVYHDPCYLGRHNSVYDEPRTILHNLNQGQSVELPNNREKSVCCGAGGGHFWMEGAYKQRDKQNVRAQEIVAQNPDILCTACPFCSITLDLGLKGEGEKADKIVQMDMIELVAENLA